MDELRMHRRHSGALGRYKQLETRAARAHLHALDRALLAGDGHDPEPEPTPPLPTSMPRMDAERWMSADPHPGEIIQTAAGEPLLVVWCRHLTQTWDTDEPCGVWEADLAGSNRWGRDTHSAAELGELMHAPLPQAVAATLADTPGATLGYFGYTHLQGRYAGVPLDSPAAAEHVRQAERAHMHAATRRPPTLASVPGAELLRALA